MVRQAFLGITDCRERVAAESDQRGQHTGSPQLETHTCTRPGAEETG